MPKLTKSKTSVAQSTRKAQNDEKIRKQKIRKRKLDPKYPKQLMAYSEKKYQDFLETKEKWNQVTDNKKKDIPVEFTAYSIEQYEQYLKHYQELIQLPMRQLKAELSKNAQSMTGNIIELATKIADGRVLGQIRGCPFCKGGLPKFNQSSGQYFCAGYRNLVYFVPCNKLIEFTEQKRIDWVK